MTDLENKLANIFIKILNRFPDKESKRIYLPKLYLHGEKYVERKLKKSKEINLKEKDIIFDNFIEKNEDKLSNIKFKMNENSTKSAVICEGRTHKHIKFIIKQVINLLDDSWCLTVVCTKENTDYVQNQLVDITNIKYKIVEKLDNFIDYNNLLLSEGFWTDLDYEKVLIFQTDSILCKRGIAKQIVFFV